jgi:chlorobactene glucosyltransferase
MHWSSQRRSTIAVSPEEPLRPGRFRQAGDERHDRSVKRLPFALSLVLLGARAWLGWRSWRAYRRLPAVTLDPPEQPVPVQGHVPFVSIVVPARNGAATLPRLLASLIAQEYPRFEVIVVDDASTDGTGAVAEAHGARVVRVEKVPRGWAGQPYACATGAAAAQGDWVLFTDAATEHDPGALRAAVAHALMEDLESLSQLTRQECRTPWEKLLLPYAASHIFAGVDADTVNDSARPELLSNGGYLLIRREAYDRAGRHAAVRASLVEDAALARVLREKGIRHRTARGEALVSVRTDAGPRAVLTGLGQEFARFVLRDRRRGALVLASLLLAGLPASGLLHVLSPWHIAGRRRDAVLALPHYAVSVAVLVPWQRRFGTAPAYALVQPLTAVLFQAVSLAGVLGALREWQRRPGRAS